MAVLPRRSIKVLLLAFVLLTQLLAAQTVRIGVLGLFHPRQITLQAVSGQALLVQAGSKNFILERSSGQDTAKIFWSNGDLELAVGNQTVQASEVRAFSRNASATDFVLSVPGKISRRYHGVLALKSQHGMLIPVVEMDLETAVASVVQAESALATPFEALKAQAVATRSYFNGARGRHHDFDFCDTTHCQFLRELPDLDSNSFRATLATWGLVLAYRDQPLAAMFTRSCGGRTRTPQQVGLSSDGYPYFEVVCDYCVRHPSRWTRHVSPVESADLQSRGEIARLEMDRRLGWDAVPSNNFIVRKDARGVHLEGSGEGHGIGLCQAGARAMAQSGATFRQILDRYYPNTAVQNQQISK